MKKFFTLFLTLMTSVMLWAYDFQSGDLYYTITSNVAPYTLEVTSGNTKYSGDITIPSSVTYNGITYAVTGISSRAFEDCSSLTSVTIPNSVKSIGDDAFSGCSSLTSMTIPNSVTSIGRQAFMSCSSLTSVTIPNSVTSIGDWAFQDCSSLTSVTIPNSVTSIGGGAFRDCSSLTSVTIPKSVTSIGTAAFGDCTFLTSVTIPESVTSIGQSAFWACRSLTSITIPNSVTSIGEYAFHYCTSLTSFTCEATTPPTLGSDVFPSNLTTAYIPCGTKEAYEASDWASYSITSFIEEDCPEPIDPTWQITYTSTDGNIVIPYKTDVFGANIVSNDYKDGQGVITFDGPVTSIGKYAFNECSSLASITIPNSVTSIGGSAFRYCTSLTSITIPNSVTSIGDRAFEHCSSLTSVTIPNNVTSIGSSAFSRCYSLTSVTIPNSVTSIGDRAFEYCTSLASITIPNSVTSIGDYAFGGCSSFTTPVYNAHCFAYMPTSYIGAYIIPQGIKQIGGGAFLDCSSLTSVTIPNSVTSIGSSAFSRCYSLTSVTIPNSVTSIGGYAFSECLDLISITIPNSVTSIGDFAFANCNSLTSITIPNSVTSIGQSAFFGCSSLTSVTIGSGVTSIGYEVFCYCTSLTSITIPNSVTSIGDRAFYSCQFLTSVTIGSGVWSIGEEAFGDCDAIQHLYVKATTPPMLGADVFPSNLNFAYIPCGTGFTYETSDWEEYIRGFFEEECEEPIDPTWQITYTSTDGNIVTPNDVNVFGANIVSNEYTDGQGVITFDGPVTSIGDDAFYYCQNLASIIIPNSVTSIGVYAFEGCNSFDMIDIPNSVISIGMKAFDDTGIYNDEFNWEYNVLYIDGCLITTKDSLITSYTIKENTRLIANSAFNGCKLLTSITIPNSVVRIGVGAFEGCSALTSLVIPNTVISIGNNAFSLCTSLESVIILEGIKSIGGHVFSDCTNLRSLTIPKSVTSLGDDYIPIAVRVPNLSSIYVAEGNPTYDSRNNCNAIIETATNTLLMGCQNTVIPNDIKRIERAAFCGAITLTTIDIPTSVDSIGYAAFANTGITKIAIPSNTLIEDTPYNQYGVDPSSREITATGAFSGCKQLTVVSLPEGMTSIPNFVFSLCSSLSSIVIPSSVTTIKRNAFSDCISLTTITIPENVSSIERCAFENCSALTDVYVKATTPPALDLFYDTNVFTSSPICHIPCGTKAAYEASDWASQVSEFVEDCEEGRQIIYTSTDGNIVNPKKTDVFGANIVSNTYENGQGVITFDGPVTSIGENAFYNRKNLTSVTIPSSVTSIESHAFRDCSSLTSVTIPSSVTSIGGAAFWSCSSLTSVVIPSSVTSIGRNPFSACPGITSIVVDENNPKYDSRNNCNGIIETATNRLITGCQNTIIPYGVTDIDHAFWGCSSLKEITIPNTVTNIGTYTFESCSLTSIVIPKSVTSIGDRAFSLCPLSTIVVEEGNPKYDSRNHCNAIIITSTNTLLAGSNNTIIPEGITAISPNAFRGRKHIASIAIPNSVTRIGESAFDGCTSLTSITIPDGVTAIKGFAFAFCDALTSVIIGKGVNSVDEGAFIMSPIEIVYFNAQEPAVMNRMGYGQFSSSPTCYIPCGTKAAYEASDWANYMKSFIETYEYTLTLSSSDNSMGSATITQEPACGTPAIIVATPNDGYFFSQWSDGNTDNPRTLTVNEDIELAAEFEEIGDYGFYSRNVRIGYNTICLPHGAIHFTGATFYEIAHILKNKKKIFFDEVKTLEAGKPYIFYPHSNEVTIYYDNTTSAVPLSHNGLHGTFDGITAASNFLKGKYLVAGNRMVLCGDGCSLAANRAYIVLDEISDKDHPAIPGIKRVSMDYSEENATNALDNITDESIVAPIQEGVYDILGRKVDTPTVSGFYIINGKKVFIAL